MARIGLEIAPVPVLGRLIQVVVLADELLELRLHIDDLLGGELELDNGNTGGFEVREETDFGGLQEQEGSAAAVGASCCASDAVDIVPGIIWGGVLNNPVYVRDLNWC
jgi:hypothetical protein